MEARQEEVLIVSKTRMKTGVCYGGIELASGKNLRLLKEHWTHRVPTQEELLKRLDQIKLEKNTSDRQILDQQSVEQNYNIGEVWLISYYHSPVITKPHTEDVIVKKAELIKNFSEEELKSYIFTSGVTIWEGSLDIVFDGLLKFYSEDRGAAYVAESSGLPSCSVGFWLPNSDLYYQEEVRDAMTKRRYLFDSKRLSLVGFQEPIDIIPHDTLVRLSLARPWSPPEANLEFRCYLQLSGWYN